MSADPQELAQVDGLNGATEAPAASAPNQSAPLKRKHLSGAEKRRRARLKAQGLEVIPRLPVASEQELMSLTGTAREHARLYRAWRLGQLSHTDYLVAIRGISAQTVSLTAVELHERQRQEMERMRAELERISSQQSAAPHLLQDFSAHDSTPGDAEVIGREPNDS